MTLRSSLHPGSAKLSLKSASTEVTRRLRIGKSDLYLRLLRSDGSVQGSYSTDGTDFTSIATITPTA